MNPSLSVGGKLLQSGGIAARLAALVPGLALCALLAAGAMGLEQLPWLSAHGLGALTIAIAAGIVVGNLAPGRIMRPSAAGVLLSKQTLLRVGIVLYGFRLTFHDISGIGIQGVAIDLLTLSTTFLFCTWLGTRIFGLDRITTMLVGTGSSICGAAAVIAAAPVLKARAEQVAIAVATVVVFGTSATFLYPFLFDSVQHLAPDLMSERAYGIYAGSTIHEVAQVVAAGRSISAAAANTAVIEKMVRVMMLAPFLLLLSAWLARHPDAALVDQGSAGKTALAIPWFAVIFVAVAGVNSCLPMPPLWLNATLHLDTFLLALAMAALGVSTHRSALRTAGIKPLLLAGITFAWLVLSGAAINLIAQRLL